MRRILVACISLILFLGPFPVQAQENAQPGGLCTLVELQPGYPGYRGFVTGLLGVGEGACLEDLLKANPWFDPAVEDAANAEAAARLGISGDASTWLWENWLAIEAERGMVPMCYQAARADMANGVQYMGAEVLHNDPRLLVGQPGTTNWIDAVSVNNGANTAQMRNHFVDDAIFRVHAWVWSGKLEPNAIELQQSGSAIHSNTGTTQIAGLVTIQGGYAPVPANACPDDQWYLAQMTMLTLYQALPGASASAYFALLEEQHSSWLNDVIYAGGIQSFRDYLIANWGPTNPFSE